MKRTPLKRKTPLRAKKPWKKNPLETVMHNGLKTYGFSPMRAKHPLRPRRKNKPRATKAETEYLAWIRQQPCWPHLCKSGLIHNSGQPHHRRTGMGMGQKAPDTDAFPICPDAHREFHHTLGPTSWARKYGKTEVEMLAHFKSQPETQAKLKELGPDFNLETSAIGRHDPKHAEQVSKGVAEDQGEDQE